ncbi:MAG: XRE family transcriptional regulator [bacterium]|nr:XRE family transcriptional regulator [bacterium]
MENNGMGDRVRKFREIKRLSMEELAERSGVEAAFLARIEENKFKPSLGTLLKVARALGIRLANFLDDSVGPDPILIRGSDRDCLGETELSSGADAPPSLVFHSLGRGKIDRHMEPFFIEIVPQPPGQVKVSQHEGEEFIAVVSGRVELQYGKDTYILEQGDSAYYSSDVMHRLVALNEEKAEIYAVIYFHT